MSRGGTPRSGTREQRIKYSEDLLWGVHAVLAALRSDPERLTAITLQKDKHGADWQELIDSARAAGIKCTFVDRLKITGHQGAPIVHQGVVARTASVALVPFSSLVAELSAAVERGERPRILALDSIQDPHNLGAIIRSAHASGVAHVIVTRERSAPPGGTAAKAAAGALATVKICQVTNLADSLQALKDAGIWIFGAIKDPQAQSIYNTDFLLPLCLVIGNEGRGIRPLVQRRCDVLVSIPMAGEIDSLNSSAAGAVILFEMYRQTLARVASRD